MGGRDDHEELFHELRHGASGQRAPSGWTAIIAIGVVIVLLGSAAFILAGLGPGAPISSARDVDFAADRAPNLSAVLISENEETLESIVELHLAFLRWLAYHPESTDEARRSFVLGSSAIEDVRTAMLGLDRSGLRVDVGRFDVSSLEVVDGSAAEGAITVRIEGRTEGIRRDYEVDGTEPVGEAPLAETFTATVVLRQAASPDDLNWRIGEMSGIPFFAP